MQKKRKVAFVSGSSRGLGRQIIKDLAKKGYDVVIDYVNDRDSALSLVEEVTAQYPVSVSAVKMDVSNLEEVSRTVAFIQDHFGRLDFLVNNAGIANDTLPLEKKKEDFMRVLEVNVYGTYLLSSLFYPLLKESRGSIVNISSTNGLNTLYKESLDYDASKAGVINLSHNLATTFAPLVRVNCVCPGWMNTDMNGTLEEDFVKAESAKILLGRFAEPMEVAKVVTFLASEEASYINDAVIRVDGGMR